MARQCSVWKTVVLAALCATLAGHTRGNSTCRKLSGDDLLRLRTSGACRRGEHRSMDCELRAQAHRSCPAVCFARQLADAEDTLRLRTGARVGADFSPARMGRHGRGAGPLPRDSGQLRGVRSRPRDLAAAHSPPRRIRRNRCAKHARTCARASACACDAIAVQPSGIAY